MWSSTVGLVNGKHHYLTAETFGYKINSNGQLLKKRQQWTIEPFPENLGPDGSISSAASVSSQCVGQPSSPLNIDQQIDPCILTFGCGGQQVNSSSLTSIKSALNGSNGSASSDHDTCGEEHENVALKSHLNKYLAVDSFGNVTCDSDEKTENARFTITICSMSQGGSKDENIFWAFRNVERGYYLGTTEDGMICCNAKMPKSRAELWHLHLIPARGASFFAIKSLGRKRYARFVDESSSTSSKGVLRDITSNTNPSSNAQVQLDATITWGQETLFQFKYYEGGKYSILTSDCLYLTNEGKCVAWCPPVGSADEIIPAAMPPAECLFTLEYHSGFIALRDSFSHYLAAAGRSSILRSRSIGVSRDELFVFESAPIQVSFKATFNNRWVSIKQGVDLSANQMETSSRFETFQLSYHKQTQMWSIMTHDCHFWTVAHNSSTISVCKPGDYEALTRGQFKLVWSETDATCSLKFIDSNQQERWIAARKSGQLYLGNNTPGQTPVKFIMRFQNRRLLNLRPVDGSGFVGIKAQSSCRQLEANKTAPDSIEIEYSELSDQSGSVSPAIVANQQHICPMSSPVKNSNGVSPRPDVSGEQQTINMFNVRLNSTRMGQSVLDKFQLASNLQQEQASRKVMETAVSANIASKEIESAIDDNNNCHSSSDDIDTKANGCNVELSSTPSVAAIINSFSNTKLGNSPPPAAINNANSHNGSEALANGHKGQSSVFRLVSNFQSGNSQQQQQMNDSDSASIITSCSTSSATSSTTGDRQHEATGGKYAAVATAEQLAQFECCYLKTISIDKYLVAGENETSVLCDATNKACAQPWILELRSHNSIAIRASDNHAYMQLGTNGVIFLQRCDPKDASLWEF